MRYFSTSLLSLALSLSLVACSEDRSEPNPPEPKQAPQEVSKDNATVAFSLDATLEEIPQKPSEFRGNPMTVRYKTSEGSNFPLKLKLLTEAKEQSEFKSVVILYNKGRKKRYTAEAVWKKENHNWTGGLGEHYWLQKVALPQEMKPGLASDDWYIMAFAGGGTYDHSTSEIDYTPKPNPQAPLP